MKCVCICIILKTDLPFFIGVPVIQLFSMPCVLESCFHCGEGKLCWKCAAEERSTYTVLLWDRQAASRIQSHFLSISDSPDLTYWDALGFYLLGVEHLLWWASQGRAAVSDQLCDLFQEHSWLIWLLCFPRAGVGWAESKRSVGEVSLPCPGGGGWTGCVGQ